MTKDRRLGRGLAALLGTPLEEDGIVDSPGAATAELGATDTRKPLVASVDAERSNAGISAGGGAARAAQPLRAAQAAAPVPRQLDSASSRATETENGTNPSPRNAALKIHSSQPEPGRGVTGSVPLTGRTSTKRSSSSRADTTLEAAEGGESSATIRSLEIDVSEIENNPFQPRRRFNETEIAALAESIREHAQLQPILVRQVGDRYQLISGERRLRATIHAGLTKIRAEVREADDRLVAELAIVENLQRKDLDPMEKAMSFRRYIDEHKCGQEDLARRLKIDRSTIANLMRLLELPAQLQTHVQNGKLSSGHARTLLPLGHEDEQIEFARMIMDEGWTVRETERRVAAHLLEQDGQNKARPNASRSGPRKRDTPHLAALEQQMRLSLGTKAEIRQQKTGRGKIVINFNNPEEFERLFALICPAVATRAA